MTIQDIRIERVKYSKWDPRFCLPGSVDCFFCGKFTMLVKPLPNDKLEDIQALQWTREEKPGWAKVLIYENDENILCAEVEISSARTRLFDDFYQDMENLLKAILGSDHTATIWVRLV